MTVAASILTLTVVVLLAAALARRFGISAPLLLTVVGVGGSFLPFLPDFRLSPDLVLIGLLPPLLYAAAIRSSLVDFRDNKGPIGFLSVGLVIFTALGVGLVAWLLLPIPFVAAFALGAVVAPPDAVAATTIARRIGLPRRVITLLEGEGLVNDATAIVLLGTAISGIVGTVTVTDIAEHFALSAVGGLVVGLAVALVIGAIHQRISDTVTHTALSLMTPYIAYLLAERIHASGVLAVVIAGLVLVHRSPVQQTATSRISERINWATIQFLLENAVFLIIGLQMRSILADVSRSELPMSTILVAAGAVLLTVIVLRPIWVFLVWGLLTHTGRAASHRGNRAQSAIVSWAGMRGVVTLAAVFVLPPRQTPHREVLVLIAMVVAAGTLLLNGSTLPAMARRLQVRGPDPREDALQEATVLQTAVSAGLQTLDELEDGVDPDTARTLRERASRRTNVVWERLGGEHDDETPGEAYRRVRLAMLASERAAVLKIRDAGAADHDVLQHVMSALDLEESMLDRLEERTQALTDGVLQARRDADADGCDHLRDSDLHISPQTPDGCPDCAREGTRPVHLRLCLACGNVGCCDSSEGRHARRHYTHTDHPVIRSFEPGEAWRWCYVDELPG